VGEIRNNNRGVNMNKVHYLHVCNYHNKTPHFVKLINDNKNFKEKIQYVSIIEDRIRYRFFPIGTGLIIDLVTFDVLFLVEIYFIEQSILFPIIFKSLHLHFSYNLH
jgi:hypothetical protein